MTRPLARVANVVVTLNQGVARVLRLKVLDAVRRLRRQASG
jgi:hypothetical protein